MPEYQEILDTEVEPEAPLTSSLGVRFRDNPIALANGASGAPRIQTAALNNGAVTQDKLASNAAGRSELKMGTNSVSGSLGSDDRVNLTMSDYALFPSMHASNDGVVVELSDAGSSSASNPKFAVINDAGFARDYSIAWRFVQA